MVSKRRVKRGTIRSSSCIFFFFFRAEVQKVKIFGGSLFTTKSHCEEEQVDGEQEEGEEGEDEEQQMHVFPSSSEIQKSQNSQSPLARGCHFTQLSQCEEEEVDGE